jgi:hypothetical protein
MPADAGEGLRAAPQTEAPVVDETAAPAAGDVSPGPVRHGQPVAKSPAAKRGRKLLALEDEVDADPVQAPAVSAEEDRHEGAPRSAAESDSDHPAVPEADAGERSESAAAPDAGMDADLPAEPGVAEAPAEAQEAVAGKKMAADPIEAPDETVPVPAAPERDEEAARKPEHEGVVASEPAAPADGVDAAEHTMEESIPEEPFREKVVAHEDLTATQAQPAGAKASCLLGLDAPLALNGTLSLDAPAFMVTRERLGLAAAPANNTNRPGAPAGAAAEPLPVGAVAQADAGHLPLPAGKLGRQQKGKPRAARRSFAQRHVIQQGLPLWDEVGADLMAAGLATVKRPEQAGQEARPDRDLLAGAGAAAAVDDVATAAVPANPPGRLKTPAVVPNPPAGKAAAREASEALAAPILAEGGSPDGADRLDRLWDADPLAARQVWSERRRDELAMPHPVCAAGPPVLRLEVAPAWPVLPDAALSSPASADALAARLAPLDPQDLRQAFRRRQFACKVPPSFRLVMAELVERQRALQTPIEEFEKSQRGMIHALDHAAELIGQAWATELHAAMHAARQPRILLPAMPFDTKAKPRPIPAREIEVHLSRLPDVLKSRQELRALLEATYRDPDQAAVQLRALRHEQEGSAVAQQLERQGAGILGRLAGTQWRLLSQTEQAKRRQAEGNGGGIGKAFVALDAAEALQRAKYIGQMHAAEAETRRRLTIAVPGLSKQAESAVAALRKAGVRPKWRQPRVQPTAEDCRLAAKIAPLWRRVLAEPALKVELEQFAQAVGERLRWPRVREIAAAVARRSANVALAETAEEKAAVLADVIDTARELHRLHPEFQRLAEIERCQSVMELFPFGKEAPRPVLALWRQDILGYAWSQRPPAAEDLVGQDIIVRWERVRAMPGALSQLILFVKAAEAALPAERVREVVLARQPDSSRPGIDRDVALVADALSVIRTASALAGANPDQAARARQVIEQERREVKAARAAVRLPGYPFGEDAPAALHALFTPQVFSYVWRQRPPAAMDPVQQDIILQWERILADKDAAARVIGFLGKVLPILPRERIREIARTLRPDGTHPDADPDLAKLAYGLSAVDVAMEMHHANPEQAELARARLAAQNVPAAKQVPQAPKSAMAPGKRTRRITVAVKGPGPGPVSGAGM